MEIKNFKAIFLWKTYHFKSQELKKLLHRESLVSLDHLELEGSLERKWVDDHLIYTSDRWSHHAVCHVTCSTHKITDPADRVPEGNVGRRARLDNQELLDPLEDVDYLEMMDPKETQYDAQMQ